MSLIPLKCTIKLYYINVLYVSVWIRTKFSASASASSLFFFLFFLKLFSAKLMLFWWVPCTVHEIHKPLFSTKLSLKMSFMSLFIHLKIILLQCFQFSIFSKVSDIQTHPTCQFPKISYRYSQALKNYNFKNQILNSLVLLNSEISD